MLSDSVRAGTASSLWCEPFSCMLLISHRSKGHPNHQGWFLCRVVAAQSVSALQPPASWFAKTWAQLGPERKGGGQRSGTSSALLLRLVQSDGIYSHTILDPRWVTDLWVWRLQFKPSYFPSCLRLRGNQTQQWNSLTLLLWLCLQSMSLMRGDIPAPLWQWNGATGFTDIGAKPANCGVFNDFFVFLFVFLFF